MFKFMRIHTVPTEEEGSTWLQLFFDLVYVAILVELGDRFSHNLDLEGLVSFVIVLLPIWWSWLEFVDYGRRYPVDDIGQRILTVLYMAAMLLLAFEIHALTASEMVTFTVTYGLSKFVLAIMYGRAWLYYPDYRHQTRSRATAFVVAGVIWIAIAFLAPSNLWLWLLPVVLGALIPFFTRQFHQITHRAELPSPPVKHHFTLHRFGELTIIVLGEFFIKLVTSSAGRQLSLVNYFIGAGLLGISVSFWWLYFDHLEHTSLARTGARLRLWTYSHFPFLAAITIYGVVGNKIFAATVRRPLDDTQRMFFSFALATAVLAYGAIEWATRERDEPLARLPQPLIRVAGAAAILAIGVFGHALNVGWLVILIGAVMFVQVGLDARQRLQRPEPEDPKDRSPAWQPETT